MQAFWLKVTLCLLILSWPCLPVSTHWLSLQRAAHAQSLDSPPSDADAGEENSLPGDPGQNPDPTGRVEQDDAPDAPDDGDADDGDADDGDSDDSDSDDSDSDDSDSDDGDSDDGDSDDGDSDDSDSDDSDSDDGDSDDGDSDDGE